ncbi:MAG: DNA-3-methyladenine glycosylase I [Candidatus Aminicenantaceae bacterium]
MHVLQAWSQRCEWVGSDPLMIEYHDKEWGVPVHDDTKLFEFLVLDAMQAGLSWMTVLKKRENFRKAFDNYDIKKIAKYDESKLEELLLDKGIIRNRQKINACIKNAQAFLEIQKEIGSFDAYIWQFVGGQTIKNSWTKLSDLPPNTPKSDMLSKNMKGRGFSFVGSTICYAFMQAAGMVNDHTIDCFRYHEVGK